MWVSFHHSTKRNKQKLKNITQGSSPTCNGNIIHIVCEGNIVLRSFGFWPWMTQGRLNELVFITIHKKIVICKVNLHNNKEVGNYNEVTKSRGMFPQMHDIKMLIKML